MGNDPQHGGFVCAFHTVALGSNHLFIFQRRSFPRFRSPSIRLKPILQLTIIEWARLFLFNFTLETSVDPFVLVWSSLNATYVFIIVCSIHKFINQFCYFYLLFLKPILIIVIKNYFYILTILVINLKFHFIVIHSLIYDFLFFIYI